MHYFIIALYILLSATIVSVILCLAVGFIIDRIDLLKTDGRDDE